MRKKSTETLFALGDLFRALEVWNFKKKISLRPPSEYGLRDLLQPLLLQLVIYRALIVAEPLDQQNKPTLHTL